MACIRQNNPSLRQKRLAPKTKGDGKMSFHSPTTSKRLTIGEIVNRLSSTQDLFAETVSESCVIDAGRRWLRSFGQDNTKVRILEEYSETLADHGYPGLAAQLMTEASLQVARMECTYTAMWRDCVTRAAEHWDNSGRLEEKRDVFLRLSGIAIRAGKQLHLFGKSGLDTRYLPVWILAKDYHRASEFDQSASIYDSLYLEAMTKEDYSGAGKASLYAAFEYVRLEFWELARDRAISSVEAKNRIDACDDFVFCSHVIAGICNLKIKPNGESKEALRCLTTAKQVLRQWKSRSSKKGEREWLFYWLGNAYAERGHELLVASRLGANRAMLHQVEDAYKNATDYFIKANDTRTFVGECFAIQGAMARLIGEVERATILEAKAIVHGYRP